MAPIETHPVPRLPLDLKAVLLVLLLCIVWGFQQTAIKGIAAQTAPVMQLLIRFAIASVLYGGWVALREGGRAFRDGTLPSGLLLGVLFSLEFVLAGQALSFTSAAHCIVFLYTAPIFTAIGLQFHPEERLSRVQWVGIAISFLGIAVAFLGFSTHPSMLMLTGDLLALIAGASWGLSNVVLRRGRVSHAATAKTVFYQIGSATVILGIYALLTGQMHVEWTALTLLSLAFQTGVIAVGSYLLWFWLLRHYQTSRLMLMSFLTPLFGVLFGAVILKDRIDANFALGSLLVLAGVLTVNLRLIARR